MSASRTGCAWAIMSWLIWGNKDGSSCPMTTTNWQGLKDLVKSSIFFSNASMARKGGKVSAQRAIRWAHWWERTVRPISRQSRIGIFAKSQQPSPSPWKLVPQHEPICMAFLPCIHVSLKRVKAMLLVLCWYLQQYSAHKTKNFHP